jgi:hypothetical protein
MTSPVPARRKRTGPGKLQDICTLAGVHAGLWLTAATPTLLIIALEATLTTAVVATALYAPQHISERAFRLLPWATRDPDRRPR